jgi:coatomer subunit alpha
VFLHGNGGPSAAALVPRPPLTTQPSNWPITKTMAELFAARWAGIEAAAKAAASNLPPPAIAEEDFEDAVPDNVLPTAATRVDVKAWGDDELDMELESVVLPVAASAAQSQATNIVAYGESREKIWLTNRRLVPDLIAAGEIGEALAMLTKRIALVNPKPLEPLFMEAVVASHVYVPGLPFTPSISTPVMTGSSPYVLFSPKFLEQKLANVLVQTGVGNAGDALEAARYCMHGLCLSIANSADEESLLKKILTTSREYAIAMLMESTRRELAQDAAQKQRELELAAYLCCSRIEPMHLLLVIGSAMNISFRAKNFILASHLARRIITGVWGSDEVVSATIMRARKVLAASEEKGSDIMKINFDPAWLSSPEQVKLCSGSLTPIHPSMFDKIVVCPFCESQYHPDFAGSTCTICQLSSVGATALGIQFTLLK